MKKSLIYFLALVATAIMSSCALTTEVHFNKNYSGTYTQNVDISGLMDMAKEFGMSDSDDALQSPIDQAMSPEERDKMMVKINKVDGISNAVFDVSDRSMMILSLEFEDVESLNNVFSALQGSMVEQNESLGGALQGIGGIGSIGLPEFSKKGKTISHSARFPKEQLPEGTLDELDSVGGSDVMMQMMKEMVDFSFDFTFDRKIKDVKMVSMELISQDKHQVKTRLDFGKFLDGEPYKIEVTTK